MELQLKFMMKYPNHYITIVTEIEQYLGASLLTDRIIKRVLCRIKSFKEKTEKPLTISVIKWLTKRAAYELVKLNKQTDVLTDDDLLNMHADNVQTPDEQLTDNELLRKVILLTQNDYERLIITAWANGCIDTDVAHILTDMYGGTFESNRSKIRRFKNKLRKDEKVQKALAV